jgi:hypothetical protein
VKSGEVSGEREEREGLVTAAMVMICRTHGPLDSIVIRGAAGRTCLITSSVIFLVICRRLLSLVHDGSGAG